jgi:cob(I)alamin adenosyltransferase
MRQTAAMPRLTKIYTRTGDAGLTGLGGGQRVPKDSQRVETYGTVDELNSQIGVALATGLCERLTVELPRIQNELFDLGSDLATPATSQARHMIDNMGAAIGRLPDEAMRRRMIEHVSRL